MSELGKKIWVFPDAYLPAKGNPYKTSSAGDQYSHESLCIVNYGINDANLIIDFLFEDQKPIENFKTIIGAKKSLHLRLDNIIVQGMNLPREKPYSIVLKSDINIVAQLSRLDTTSQHNSFMTVMGWGN